MEIESRRDVLRLDPDRIVRVNVAARLTGVPRRTLRFFAQTGVVPARKINKRAWGFRAADLEFVRRKDLIQ